MHLMTRATDGASQQLSKHEQSTSGQNSHASYSVPPRSPSTTHSRSFSRSPPFRRAGSEYSIVSARSHTSEKSSVITPAYSFQAYYQQDLGFLPPPEVCRLAGKTNLARAPIQVANKVDSITSIHRHFFSPGNEGDAKKVSLLMPKDRYIVANFWFCRVEGCDKKKPKSGSTRLRLAHVKKFHPEIALEIIEFRQLQGEPLQAANDLWKSHEKKPKERGKGLNKNDHETLARVIAEGIALDNLPFSILTSQTLRNVIRFFDPECPVPGIAAIETALDKEYYSLLFKAKKILQVNVSYGSFTADTWTSKGEGRKFLGLTFHYLDPEFVPHSVAIGFKAMPEQHTGDALKEKICE
ncbi:hypothetical protein BGZ76_006105 [Entomortierella beljakovae]|nr:hypothetical protein BGZ76_006105 [Entomortierella beljakovae]